MLDSGHIYKASLDKAARWNIKYGTYSFIIIMLLVTLLMYAALGIWGGLAWLLLITIITVSVALSDSISAYVLYSDKLVIKRIVASRNVEIKLTDIVKAERFTEEEFKKSKRYNNISIFGYFGDFKHPVYGYYKMYATNLSNLIIIELKNSKKLVISPDDMGLLQVLQPHD